MNQIIQQLCDFLRDQWPALLILIYQYQQVSAIHQKYTTANNALAISLQAAHAKIDALNAGKSSASIVDEAAGQSSGPESTS